MKIKSKTDVITNSSSEVFIIKNDNIPNWTEKGQNSNCIDISPITLDTFKWEQDTLCDLMDWDYKETGGTYIKDAEDNFWNYWEWDEDIWNKWISDHKKEIENKIEDLSWVDIEDHYEWDSYETDRDRAMNACIWHDYRH